MNLWYELCFFLIYGALCRRWLTNHCFFTPPLYPCKPCVTVSWLKPLMGSLISTTRSSVAGCITASSRSMRLILSLSGPASINDMPCSSPHPSAISLLTFATVARSREGRTKERKWDSPLSVPPTGTTESHWLNTPTLRYEHATQWALVFF